MKAAEQERPSRANLTPSVEGIEERRARAESLYLERGLTMQQTADELGVSKRAVFNYLRFLGVETRPAAPRAKYPRVGEIECARDGCSNRVKPKPSRAARGPIYCSTDCYHEARRLYPGADETVCARDGCHERFTPEPWRASRFERLFCSRECYDLAKRIHPYPGLLTCARDGCDNVFTPPAMHVARGWGRYCGSVCWGLDRWRKGIALERRVALLSGRSRQIWLGRWGGRDAGKLGGRPRISVSDEQRLEIERLAGQGWGRRAIASRLFVSERAVRSVLERATP
jgi:hypothetical protein